MIRPVLIDCRNDPPTGGLALATAAARCYVDHAPPAARATLRLSQDGPGIRLETGATITLGSGRGAERLVVDWHTVEIATGSIAPREDLYQLRLSLSDDIAPSRPTARMGIYPTPSPYARVGQLTLTAGIASQFPTMECEEIAITADPDNADTVRIGLASVDATSGDFLPAGATKTYPIDNASRLWAFSTAGGTVSYYIPGVRA